MEGALTGLAQRRLTLAQVEIDGSAGDLLVHRLLDSADLPTIIEPSTTTRDEYARRITAGGMPVALRRPPGRSRSRWFASYLDLLIDRDVVELTRIRQREMLPRLLAVLASRSGQVLNIAAAAQAVGMEKSSAESYLRLLEAVFLVQRLPAWGTTLGSRVARMPKVHVVDAGVMAWLRGHDGAALGRSLDAAVLRKIPSRHRGVNYLSIDISG